MKVVADYVLKHHYPHLTEGALAGGTAAHGYAVLGPCDGTVRKQANTGQTLMLALHNWLL